MTAAMMVRAETSTGGFRGSPAPKTETSSTPDGVAIVDVGFTEKGSVTVIGSTGTAQRYVVGDLHETLEFCQKLVDRGIVQKFLVDYTGVGMAFTELERFYRPRRDVTVEPLPVTPAAFL